MEKNKFSLLGHPWLFLLVFIIFTVVCQLIVGALLYTFKLPFGSPTFQFWLMLLSNLLLLFVIVPFVMGFPKRSRPYETYLTEIRFAKVTPFFKLLLLGITCYVILALGQVLGVIVFRLVQGLPIDAFFLRYSFTIANELPPNSPSWYVSLPSVLEEVAFRGVVLAMFLRFYSQPKAIVFSAIGFGIIHLGNIVSGGEPIWVIGQVVWAAIMGVFYGYVTLKTGSLLPAMLVHYLSNFFVSALNAYIQSYGTLSEQAIFGVIFTFGAVPVVLMMLWTRGFTKWFKMSTEQILLQK
jgi:membrane protease YdiL (CAAX protease family)